MAKTLCKHCKAINPSEAPTCHNCGQRIALGPLDAATCSPSPILMPVTDITYKGTADYLSAKLRTAEKYVVSARKERDEARRLAEDQRNQHASGDKARLIFPWENAKCPVAGGKLHTAEASDSVTTMETPKSKRPARCSRPTCSPLARKMLDAAKNRKGDLFGDAAKRVIRVADEGMSLYEIAQWNNVVDVLNELSKFTENASVEARQK